MNESIILALQKLKNDIQAIQNIKFWLEEYIDLYKIAINNWNKDSCFEELPCSHTLNNDMSKFISFYESLNELVNIHKYESYFKQELIYYQNIKNNLFDLNELISKNEKLCANQLTCFFTDYLDYSENPNHLRINTTLNNSEIFIERMDFINTISFLEVFNDLYFEKDI
jgi:hypothetical protein